MYKKIFGAMFAAVALTSCTEDFTADWTNHTTEAEEAAKHIQLNLQTAEPIVMAEVTDDSVQVFTYNISSDEPISVQEYFVVLTEGEKTIRLNAGKTGKVATADLEAAVKELYGRRPVAHEIAAQACISAKVGALIVEKHEDVKITVTPDAPVIEEAYYVTGTINGWDNNNTDYVLVNGGGDVYDDPVFTCTIPAEVVTSDLEFKLTPKSGLGGDWSGCLTAGAADGVFADKNAGGNFFCAMVGDAKVYKLTFDMLEMTYSIVAQSFSENIYFIGATDGWTNAEQTLVGNGEGKYTGYIYCADPNSWGNQFKFQQVPGDWGTEINNSFFTEYLGAATDCGGNIGVSGGENVYYFEVDLVAGKISATEVTTMGIIGDFNGWAADAVMTWDAANYCYVCENPGINANGWKFRVNSDWGLNLGANDNVEPSTMISDLVANGKNLGVAGTTVKLYPCRRGTTKIYCTVE